VDNREDERADFRRRFEEARNPDVTPREERWSAMMRLMQENAEWYDREIRRVV